MPLVAIDAVHQLRMGDVRPRSSGRPSHRGGSRHRSPSGRGRDSGANPRPHSSIAPSSASEMRPGSTLSAAAVRKMTRAPGAAVRLISVHSALSCSSLIQSCASSSTKRSTDDAGFLRQQFGEVDVVDADATDVGLERRVVRLVEIGGQGAFARRGIAPRESLPGEIVVLQREVAGELFEPRLQHAGHRAVAGGDQRIILRRRNAEAEQRRLARQHQLHQPRVEHRRELLLEEAALAADVALSRGWLPG